MNGGRQYALGIDPGVKNGLAVYCRRSRKLDSLFTLDFWALIRELELWISDAGLANFEVFIEDVCDISPTYANKQGVANGRALNKISQNVGMNKRDCQLLKEWMEQKGIQFTALSPRGRKYAKMDAEIFRLYTGWGDASSQHSRDAAVLVFGR